jgi:DNA polymerase-4
LPPHADSGYAGGMARTILHVDMDEFFAAVEKLDDPSLRGKCLLIGGSPAARGVVSTASYEARMFGCRSAMPMATAIRLCPHAVVLPVRGARYRHVSDRIFDIFGRFSPQIEPLSIDEAFLDVTGCRRLLGSGEQIARSIKQAIRDELSLTASVGVAPNKFLAKLASDLRKPDGLVVLTDRTVHETLDPLPIGKLWGIGPAAAERFARLNIHTIGQLRRTPVETLTRAIGEMGEHFHRLAEGLDDRPVTPDGQAKSISQECTFAVDVGDPERLREVLLGQAEQVARRLRRHDLKTRTVTVKLRTGDFTTRTRSATLDEPTDLTEDIWRQADALLTAWAGGRRRPLRLIGLAASQLVRKGAGQLSLFAQPGRQKQRRLDEALDEIAERFGDKAVRRGRVERETDSARRPRREEEGVGGE